MGFFSSLGQESYDRQYSDRQLVRRMLGYFRPHSRLLTSIGILLIVLALLRSSVPMLVGYGVDLIATQSTADQITLLVAAVFAAGALFWLANWRYRRLIAQAVGDIVMAMRTDAFAASVAHDLSFYDEFSSGRIVSRITSDTREFGQVVNLITDLMVQITQALFLLIVLATIELRLTMILVSILPVVFLAASGYRRLSRRVTRRGMRAMSNVNATIKETVSGIAVAKNFRQESGVFETFDEVNQQSFQVNIRRGLVISLIFPTLEVISGVGTAMLVYAGGMTVAQGAVSVGAWYLFIISLQRFWWPILQLSAFWTQLQAGLSAAERVFALIDAEHAVVQEDDRPVTEVKGEIIFDKVWFRYSEQEQVLCDFDLHVQPGESVALVGHTGAGKSSIANLVARFYEFQEGRIMIDGQDIRSFDLGSYRRKLGIVTQIPFLFSGTVIENIRYARPEAGDAEIEALAKQIGKGEWLETLPQGLHTTTGERGGMLSMGQRQLVALLRVLVQNPAIFILDEATASIDPFTEWQIQQALQLVLSNTTSILIAHRLSTVKAADRIIVLEKGRIIEEGNHEGLMSQGGHYANLYNTYFRHQSLAYVEEARTMVEGD